MHALKSSFNLLLTDVFLSLTPVELWVKIWIWRTFFCYRMVYILIGTCNCLIYRHHTHTVEWVLWTHYSASVGLSGSSSIVRAFCPCGGTWRDSGHLGCRHIWSAILDNVIYGRPPWISGHVTVTGISKMMDRMWRHPKWWTGYDVLKDGQPDMTASKMADRILHHQRWQPSRHVPPKRAKFPPYTTSAGVTGNRGGVRICIYWLSEDISWREGVYGWWLSSW